MRIAAGPRRHLRAKNDDESSDQPIHGALRVSPVEPGRGLGERGLDLPAHGGRFGERRTPGAIDRRPQHQHQRRDGIGEARGGKVEGLQDAGIVVAEIVGLHDPAELTGAVRIARAHARDETLPLLRGEGDIERVRFQDCGARYLGRGREPRQQIMPEQRSGDRHHDGDETCPALPQAERHRWRRSIFRQGVGSDGGRAVARGAALRPFARRAADHLLEDVIEAPVAGGLTVRVPERPRLLLLANHAA